MGQPGAGGQSHGGGDVAQPRLGPLAARFVPTRTYQAAGQYCREFQQNVTIGGKRPDAYGTDTRCAQEPVLVVAPARAQRTVTMGSLMARRGPRACSTQSHQTAASP